MARAIAIGLGILATSYLVAMICFQRRLLFPRPSATSGAVRPTEGRQVWLPTEVGRVEAWYLPPATVATQLAPVLIFFHGNGELIDDLPEQFLEPRGWGLGVLLVEFPGYGRSAGAPSQDSITSAARAAFDWAQAEGTIDPSRVVAYGRSLGGGAAAILANERPTSALILESTFTSIRSFAHSFWVPEFAVLDPFETLPIVRAYKGPVLVLHGSHDELIPSSHAEALANATPRAELHLMPCGHNNCIRPWATMRAFLRQAGVIAP